MKRKKRMNLSGINKIILNTNKEFHKRLNIIKKAFIKYEEPYTEISQNASKVFIKVKLPEVKKKNLFLKVAENNVAVRGDLIKRHKLLKGYYKDIEIPEDALTERIRASFKNNVLNIKIPKIRRI